ncbi:hypothetical protein D6D06_05253 [Aureobasidium pullulans]|nr:hypothetical protein D6D06_05253 [Aureobasidium pullulans]THX69781.1 hypothetical protein D6D05_08877 [Aureobasidium pullulans]
MVAGFVLWRLATDYKICTDSFDLDLTSAEDQRYYLDLCKRYCMFLGRQFDSTQDTTTAKQDLMRDVFRPAKKLGIPAGTRQLLYFPLRCLDLQVVVPSLVENIVKSTLMRIFEPQTSWKHSSFSHASSPTPLDSHAISTPLTWHGGLKQYYYESQWTILYWPMLLKLANFQDSHAKSRIKCIALHQLHYPWMLDPRLIDPCDCGDAGKQHRAEDSDSDSHSEEMYCGYSAAGSSDNNSLVRYSIRSPSTVLAYRRYTSRPLVAALSLQGRRPCGALFSPDRSDNICVSAYDMRRWREKVKDNPHAYFQSRCHKTRLRARNFSCGLPNKIRLAGLQWTNPDGGAPKLLERKEDAFWIPNWIKEAREAKEGV